MSPFLVFLLLPRKPWLNAGAFFMEFIMQDYAVSFYKSKEWKQCRAAYAKSVGGLCERCFAKGMIVPGVIVHHKTHISPENITNPLVTLNWENLELLCRDCHGEEHSANTRRYWIDGAGKAHVISHGELPVCNTHK